MPDISVIMTTYNDAPEFVTECIESVLNQTYKDIEFVIVIEPGETNTDILESVERIDNRVRVLKNDKRLGIAGSRNRAIRESSAKYIAIIDGDDYCDLMRFQKQSAFLESNTDVSVVGSNLYLVDNKGHIAGERRYPEFNDGIKRYFLLTMGIANPSVMVRRRDLEEVGLFDADLMKAEDMELWLRFLRFGKKMHILQENLVYYRLPPEETSKRNKTHMLNVYAARRKHSKYIWGFLQRSLSLAFWSVVIHIPGGFIDDVLNSKIVKKMRKYSAVKELKLN